MGVSGVQEKRYKLMDWIQTTITTNSQQTLVLKVFIFYVYSANQIADITGLHFGKPVFPFSTKSFSLLSDVL